MGDKNQSGVEKQSIVKGQRKRRATTEPTQSRENNVGDKPRRYRPSDD